MKVSIDDVELFALTEPQKLVMKNNISGLIFDEDLKRRIQWVIMHKYEQCLRELKEEWDDKLAINGVALIPTNPEAYAALVFSQPNYLDKEARDQLLESNQL